MKGGRRVQAVIFIPARFASSRFPGKPLAAIRGATGQARSLIRRSWDAACAALPPAQVFVLTDSAEIAEPARGFGAQVLMTPAGCRNGSERCAAALEQLETRPDVVINLQGDALLTPPDFVAALMQEMRDAPAVSVATPVLKTSPEQLANLLADRRAGRAGATTAVFDARRDALYFSKEILPHYDDAPADAVAVYHHVGCYAYRPGALEAYLDLPEGPLERREGLEQLRFLENGLPVRCVPVSPPAHEFWELNNPSDIPIIEAILARGGLV